MDITLNKTKSFSNQFINSETVNYTIAFSFSFFILLAVKQLFKTFSVLVFPYPAQSDLYLQKLFYS